jgi:NIPSNAP/Cupin domain
LGSPSRTPRGRYRRSRWHRDAYEHFLELYRTEGKDIQLKYLTRLLGFFITDIGVQFQVVHLWRYEDHAERDRCRAAMKGSSRTGDADHAADAVVADTDIVSGKVEWTIGGETRVVKGGDAVHIPPNTVHSVKVVGEREDALADAVRAGRLRGERGGDRRMHRGAAEGPEGTGGAAALDDFHLPRP